jgi:Arc/MetJ-type ribon-helix-helix transcriptional regulator
VTIEIKKPELEKLMQEEIKSGRFENVDDLMTQALHALREKNGPEIFPKRRRLIDVLRSAPFAGSELPIERLRQYPRSVDL